MKKIIIFTVSLFVLMTGCGGTSPVTNSTNNTVANNGNATANVNANSANTNVSTNTNSNANSANKNTNANTAKPADNSPKRVAFKAGETHANENLTLAAGESKKFVIGAKKGQFLVVEPDANKPTPEELKVTVIKGKVEKGDLSPFLSATLDADGDYVFEVKNLTKKELKLLLRVQIDDGPQ